MSKKHSIHLHLEMCLCPNCASHYYASPYRFIRPLHKEYQATLAPCDLCHVRLGKAFHISFPS